MNWDVGFPLVAFIAQCATTYVAWRATVDPLSESQPGRKRVFEAVIWLSFLAGAGTIILSGIRGDALSKKLDDLSNKQSKRAFIVETKAHPSQYEFGKKVCVSVYYKNAGDDAARSVLPVNGLRIVSGLEQESNQGGTFSAPNPTEVDALYEEFAKEADREAGNPGISVFPGTEYFHSPCVPETVVTRELDQQLASGKRILLLISRYRWKDSNGEHLSERCQWFQKPTKENVWHDCADHNTQLH